VKTDLSLREMAYLAWQSRRGESCLETRRVAFRLSSPYVILQPSAVRDALAGG
jgi:hypothetical protein